MGAFAALRVLVAVLLNTRSSDLISSLAAASSKHWSQECQASDIALHRPRVTRAGPSHGITFCPMCTCRTSSSGPSLYLLRQLPALFSPFTTSIIILALHSTNQKTDKPVQHFSISTRIYQPPRRQRRNGKSDANAGEAKLESHNMDEEDINNRRRNSHSHSHHHRCCSRRSFGQAKQFIPRL